MTLSATQLILGILAVLSFLLGLWQWWIAARFPLHQRRRSPTDFHRPLPAVTLLKPIKGCDQETERCLRSWLTQDYAGPIQMVCGVASPNDKVVPLIRRLIAEFPTGRIDLIICEHELGINAKVSNLVQMRPHARHEVLCVSDADVCVPPDYLTEAVELLGSNQVGLVNSFYESNPRGGIGMRWEAFAINADFWSQVLQSASMKPIDFALGAVMLFRGIDFDRVGGFTSLADFLADDYQLGHRLAQAGWAIKILPVVVQCRSEPSTFAAIWWHQLRWARTIRACQEIPYFMSILSNATLWPLLWLAISFRREAVVWAVAGMLLTRGVQGAWLEHRLTRRWDLASVPMAWMKDVLQIFIWGISFLGRSVSWRGVLYRVDKGGKLTRLRVSS